MFTLDLGLDQVEHLAEQILEGQGFDAHSLHPLALLLVEVLQLKHGQDAVSIHVHAAEPVLDAGERSVRRRVYFQHSQRFNPHTQRGEKKQYEKCTWLGFSCLLQI